MTTNADILLASNDAVQEAIYASLKFAPFNSAHERYAVLAEEVDKLWEVALRFIADVRDAA